MFCRCDGTDMRGNDHCPECGCEEFEEREPVRFDRETGQPVIRNEEGE